MNNALAVYTLCIAMGPYGRRIRLADLRRALDGIMSREEQDQTIKELVSMGKVLLLAEADPSLEDQRAEIVVGGTPYHSLKASV